MLKEFLSFFLIATLLLLLAACDNPALTHTDKTKTLLQGKTMGTSYHVVIVHSDENIFDNKALQINIDELLKDLNQQVSTYIPSSQINQFNQSKNISWMKVNNDFFTIVEAAQMISKASNGAFDITISPLIDVWGFGANTKKTSPKETEISNLRTLIGYQQLQIDSVQSSIRKLQASLRIDLSAIAKGFAVDKISSFLSAKGYSNHLVEIGGELRASGTNQTGKNWRIAVEQPDSDTTISSKGIELSNRAIATSGDYRNYFIDKGVRRSHIIDPATGYPIKHKLASVTVLHESTMLADAYATAILVMGDTLGKAFAEENNLDVLMIIRDENKFKFWSSSNLFH